MMMLSGLCAIIALLSSVKELRADWKAEKVRQSSSTGDRDNGHKSIHQTIVLLEDDLAVIEAGTYLFERNPNSSTLVKTHHGALHILRGGNLIPSKSDDIVLVGHGKELSTGDLSLAGYSAEEVATYVSSLKTKFLIDPSGTISLISCNLGSNLNYTLKLLQALRSLNVKAKLRLYNTPLSVNTNGQILIGRDGVWTTHDYSSSVIAELSPKGGLLTRKLFGCAGSVYRNYEGNILYSQSLEWPRHPQMFVPMELRKKYPSIDCLEGLTWSLFFEENEKRRAPDYIPSNDYQTAVWLEVTEETSINLKRISNIQDLLVEIRYCAREEVTSDLYYVLNDCIYKVHGKNLSVSLVGKFMKTSSEAEIELFRQTFSDQQAESSLQELQQGLKASKFNDFCRQTFQFQQCTYNCERWGRYFMAAVFSASVRNFRTFSLFLMSVIGCEVGRSRGSDSPLCTAFVGENHPMITEQPWPEHVKRGFYGCTVDDYQMAPQQRQIWLDQVIAKENSLYIKSKQMMDAIRHNDQTELEIFGKIKVMNKYVFSSYLEYFRGTPEGKKLKRGCTPTSFYDN
ncbi:PREDICTED: uncharacterized protein LOC107103944 [Cyprinodon variegatus]|uniref:uncharacterized protein LOC107103944 n=1 Tax=Cyprinodon variegatus TaxID=28743 RepID=UPI0007426597|nr:PREDICTED: uncharacterized protein LOC107103944 [Cyprinodon variegatus]